MKTAFTHFRPSKKNIVTTIFLGLLALILAIESPPSIFSCFSGSVYYDYGCTIGEKIESVILSMLIWPVVFLEDFYAEDSLFIFLGVPLIYLYVLANLILFLYSLYKKHRMPTLDASLVSFTSGVGSRSGRLWYIALAFFIAGLYDYVFWENKQGIGLIVFVLIYLAVFVPLIIRTKQLRQKWALLLLVPIFILSADVFLYTNVLVQVWLPWCVYVLLFLFSILVTLQNPLKFAFSFSRIFLFRRPLFFLRRLGFVYKDTCEWGLEHNKRAVKKILFGVLISVPFLLFFGFLFFSADAVFAQQIRNIFDYSIGWETAWRVIRTILIALAGSGIAYILITKEHVLGEKISKVPKPDSVVIGTMLLLVNVLFFMFVFIQIKYLFGSAQFVFEHDTTFAEYARRGFFELVFVVAAAAVLLSTIYRSFVHHGQHRFIIALQALLTVQVGVIAVSALRRLNLYQDEFGYTVLRLYVEWFIYTVLAILLLFIGSIVTHLQFRKFFYTALIIGFAAFTGLASLNIDRIIAAENVQRFMTQPASLQDKKDIDLVYLASLSADVVPEVTVLLNEAVFSQFDDPQKLQLRAILQKVKEENSKRNTWQERHIGAQESARQLAAISPDVLQTVQKEFDRVWYPIADVSVHRMQMTGCHTVGQGENAQDQVCFIDQLGNSQYAFILSKQPLESGTGSTSVFSIYEYENKYGFLNDKRSSENVVYQRILAGNPETVFRLLSAGHIVESVPEENRHYIRYVRKGADGFHLEEPVIVENEDILTTAIQ